MHESNLTFSEAAKNELSILGDAVQEILHLTTTALEKDDESYAYRIEPLEEVIDDMVLMLRNRHTDRLCKGICSIDSGLIFLDTVTQLERAADQCSSIALFFLGKKNDAIMHNHHLYLQELHASNDQPYLEEQAKRREQFLVPLQNIQN